MPLPLKPTHGCRDVCAGLRLSLPHSNGVRPAQTSCIHGYLKPSYPIQFSRSVWVWQWVLTGLALSAAMDHDIHVLTHGKKLLYIVVNHSLSLSHA